MNCSRCGAPSHVVSTTSTRNGALRRERRCDHGHGFLTFEVYSTVFTAQNFRLRQVAKTVDARVQMWRRNRLILAEWHKGVEYLQKKFGLKRSTVFRAARLAREDAKTIPAVRRHALKD